MAFRADLYRWRATCSLGNCILRGSGLVRNSSQSWAAYENDEDIVWGDAHAHIVWWRDLDEEDFVWDDDGHPAGSKDAPVTETD